jgi:hypothetical protein
MPILGHMGTVSCPLIQRVLLVYSQPVGFVVSSECRSVVVRYRLMRLMSRSMSFRRIVPNHLLCWHSSRPRVLLVARILSPPASSGARHRRRSTSQLVRDQLAGDKAEFPLAFLISTTRLGAAPIHAVAWNGRDTQLILVSRGASSRRIVSNHFSLVLALLSFESVT